MERFNILTVRDISDDPLQNIRDLPCLCVWSPRPADWASAGMVTNPGCGQPNREKSVMKSLFAP